MKEETKTFFRKNRELSVAERKRRRVKQNRWLRVLLQVLFFVLMPGAFVAGFSGVKYIFQRISDGSVLEWNSFLFSLAALAGFTILFGRFFCGYACAFGSLGDFVYWISGVIQKKILKRKKQLAIPERIDPWAQKIKYVVLAAVVILCSFGIYETLGGWSPWSVFSYFTSLKFHLEGFLPGLILFLAIVIGMALKERFFCQYLCPMGALFSLLPQLPFSNLKRNPEQCIKGCSACKKNCPVNIQLEADGFLNGECIGCERCADICPKGNLTRWDRKLFRHEAVAVLVKAILFFVLGILAGFSRI